MHDRTSEVHAAYSRHWSFEDILGLPAAEQLSSSAMARLLCSALTFQGGHYIIELWQLPAAAAMRHADMANLLLAMFQAPTDRGTIDLMYNIMQLPAFIQLSSTEVATLLSAAAGHYISGLSGDEGVLIANLGLARLCGLPSAQEFSGEQVLQPLKIAMRRGAFRTKTLCKLPAAQQRGSCAAAEGSYRRRSLCLH